MVPLLTLAAAIAGTVAAAPEPYPRMAPLDQYLIADRSAEIALARSAAPDSVASGASVWVLGRNGYETAVAGHNGFTCLVERAWMNAFDNPEFWNPKMRGPVCYNAAASHSVLQYTVYRTNLVLKGVSKAQLLAQVQAAVGRRELRPPEAGAMSYMMGSHGYLSDEAGPWHSHLMFHIPKTDGASWGANLPGSPVIVDTRFSVYPEPQIVFMVPVEDWSDATPAKPHH